MKQRPDPRFVSLKILGKTQILSLKISASPVVLFSHVWTNPTWVRRSRGDDQNGKDDFGNTWLKDPNDPMKVDYHQSRSPFILQTPNINHGLRVDLHIRFLWLRNPAPVDGLSHCFGWVSTIPTWWCRMLRPSTGHDWNRNFSFFRDELIRWCWVDRLEMEKKEEN